MEQHASHQPLLPVSHHGAWAGPNRLWIMDPAQPFRSNGSVTVGAHSIQYAWSHDGRLQSGSIELKGLSEAMRADWRDSFHARDAFTLHGFADAGVVRLFTTYDAGEQTWGWQIELDFRDPEACVLRMFNVMPGLGAVPAVVLQGAR